MKYKQLKDITLGAIYLAQPDKGCRDFQQSFDEFLDWVNSNFYRTFWMNSRFFRKIPLEILSKNFDKHPKWRDFLIKHEFIEEVPEEQEEQYFKAGDEFYLWDSECWHRLIIVSPPNLESHAVFALLHLNNSTVRGFRYASPPHKGVPLSVLKTAYNLTPKEKS